MGTCLLSKMDPNADQYTESFMVQSSCVSGSMVYNRNRQKRSRVGIFFGIAY